MPNGLFPPGEGGGGEDLGPPGAPSRPNVLISGITETIFPAVGKGMPDVITYLDEVPWSTTADVKPMKKSVMEQSFADVFVPDPSGVLFNPVTPYLFFSITGLEGSLDTGINATDLTVTSEDFKDEGARPIVYINGSTIWAFEDPSWNPFFPYQFSQQLSSTLGPFMMIDDEIMRYENPLATLTDSLFGDFYYYPDTDDFIIPSVSERGMFGTTAASHLSSATIKELIVGYITGIEYNSGSEMVTIRTNIMQEIWEDKIGYYDVWQSLPPDPGTPYTYRDNLTSTPNPYAFSVPNKQISAMKIGLP